MFSAIPLVANDDENSLSHVRYSTVFVVFDRGAEFKALFERVFLCPACLSS